jgi:hypothetical protein
MERSCPRPIIRLPKPINPPSQRLCLIIHECGIIRSHNAITASEPSRRVVLMFRYRSSSLTPDWYLGEKVAALVRVFAYFEWRTWARLLEKTYHDPAQQL